MKELLLRRIDERIGNMSDTSHKHSKVKELEWVKAQIEVLSDEKDK